MKKIMGSLLTFVLLASIAPAAAVKPKGDWNAVKNSAGQEIAVKTKGGRTSFGILRSADDSGLSLQLANKEGWEPHETPFRREDVEKVWRARLRFDERNTGKGAWIGAGAGLGVAIAVASIGENADACVGCGLFPFYGAGIGALIGRFSRKGHKKRGLIYSV